VGVLEHETHWLLRDTVAHDLGDHISRLLNARLTGELRRDGVVRRGETAHIGHERCEVL
jgi:hypothetical protein